MSQASLTRLPADITMARPISPWFVALAVTVPTFMEVLDTSIANVALQHIAGGLSAAADDSEWVITSYLAANAIVLPISGWLSTYLGRRRYFLLSVAIFTVSSGLCGMAANLEQLILFRILQGLAGGGLQPSTQAVLLDEFPSERQGAAMTMFGIAALIAPILGPTLGGWITDNYSWRWIFYINLPTGFAALALSWFLLHDPQYLRERRAEMLRRPLQFDFIGLGLLALGVSCLEIVLSKGQEWDWFGDPFGRVQLLTGVLSAALTLVLLRELTAPQPLVDLRPLANRNFAFCCTTIFATYGALYGGLTSLPGMLQTLLGYDATTSGMVMSPAGIASVMMMPLVGFLLGKKVDARWLIAIGASVMAFGMYWMSQLNLFVGPWEIIVPRIVQAVGTSMMFAPLSVAAYMYLPREQRAAAVGLFALLRNEGASVGTSLAKTLIDRREQFHELRLNENLDPLNPALTHMLPPMQQFLYEQTGDPAGSEQMAWQGIELLREQQANSLAFFDCFWAFAIVSLLLVPLALSMRRSVAEEGARLAAE